MPSLTQPPNLVSRVAAWIILFFLTRHIFGGLGGSSRIAVLLLMILVALKTIPRTGTWTVLVATALLLGLAALLRSVNLSAFPPLALLFGTALVVAATACAVLYFTTHREEDAEALSEERGEGALPPVH